MAPKAFAAKRAVSPMGPAPAHNSVTVTARVPSVAHVSGDVSSTSNEHAVASGDLTALACIDTNGEGLQQGSLLERDVIGNFLQLINDS